MPPRGPRTDSTTPARASWCTTFIRWFFEMPYAAEISVMVASRARFNARYISTRSV